MAYRLKRKESAQKALRRIAAEQLCKGLDELRDDALGRDAAVHQVRKRCKKLRGLFRLMRGAMDPDDFDRENAHYRDTARLVAGLREAAVAMKTLDALEPAADPDQRVALLRAREALPQPDDTGGDDAQAQLDAFAAALEAGRARLGGISLSARRFDAVAPGLRRTYARGRKEMRAARDSRAVGDLHDWRKRVKYHWYHVRLLQNLWPEPMHARRREMSRLSDLLGDDHDLADLDAALPDDTGLDPLRGLIAGRRRSLQDAAFTLGARVYAETPKAHVARMQGYWQAWRG
ncbi:CHAD domain-containing protein [Rhodobacteraceae bacterium 2CG4]|uniref:CHAD domain-containing protein n=1 Tax=Halovulum marinum TaxID=2662447 RepID=A0A6L5Z2A0_9RHOB|nr:CHAD domain-containing protein [Halovulum marinum]MSU90693.1 CHAD domain-containing protein [Halovulum marinum]